MTDSGIGDGVRRMYLSDRKIHQKKIWRILSFGCVYRTRLPPLSLILPRTAIYIVNQEGQSILILLYIQVTMGRFLRRIKKRIKASRENQQTARDAFEENKRT